MPRKFLLGIKCKNSEVLFNPNNAICPGGGGGGGGGDFHMHIGYVSREKPQFSAINFQSGAYHFHNYVKIFRSGASPYYIFCRSGGGSLVLYKNMYSSWPNTVETQYNEILVTENFYCYTGSQYTIQNKGNWLIGTGEISFNCYIRYFVISDLFIWSFLCNTKISMVP